MDSTMPEVRGMLVSLNILVLCMTILCAGLLGDLSHDHGVEGTLSRAQTPLSLSVPRIGMDPHHECNMLVPVPVPD
eukprot:1140758-Pelagomonas_calceolata.AAC.4